MGLSRARVVALPFLVVAALAAGIAAPAGAAERRAAPSVTLHQLSADVVAVSGRTATAAPRVRIDRYTGSGWAVVKQIRARHHHYATSLRLAAGAGATFRVVSDHRARRFVVRMAARQAPPVAPKLTLYDACGARPWKSDGSAWSCTFHDDFDGTTLDRTKWVPQTSGYVTGDATAGYACYVDDPDNVAVSSGMLSLTVRKVASPVTCSVNGVESTTDYTAGMVSTYHLFSQQYGRFEARIRNTASDVAGLHEAFWLWPDDRVASSAVWPDAGEIDISETYSLYNSLSVPFLHYSADSSGPQPGVNTAYCAANRGEWNTYTLEWGPAQLSIFVNGRLCLSNTSGDPAFMKPYILLLTQALGQGDNALTDQTPIPATMDIDYVRVWQ